MIDLREVLRLHGLWLHVEEGGARAVLIDADLTGADLTRAVLIDADLTGADLTRAVLTGADLTGADLTRADLIDADLTGAVLIDADLTGADLTRAVLTGADLTDAVLIDADLTRAVLTRADLTGAVLTGADLTRADLTGAVLPGLGALRVENLHVKVLAAIDAGGELEMGSWHQCHTTHCRAGWYVHLAGDAGKLVESLLGPAAAGALIFAASCPCLERVPDFYCGNEQALADIKRCAEIEAAQGLA